MSDQTAPDLPHHPGRAQMPPGERPPGPVPWGVSLVVNLLLGVSVTVLLLTQVDHLVRVALKHGSYANVSPDSARSAIRGALYGRAVTNVLVGIFYVFLIIRLRAGRWRAWRRMVWLSFAGSVGMVYLLTQPYTAIFKVEQLLQLMVLVAIGACMLHPLTRAYVGPRPSRSRRG